jgi:hypothetical protein
MEIKTYGRYITLKQLCDATSLGLSSARKLAQDSGAVRHIGRSVRVETETVFNFIEEINKGAADENN